MGLETLGGTLRQTHEQLFNRIAEQRPFLIEAQRRIDRGDLTLAPKLHIHSRSDEVVPFSLGRRLFDEAPEPKRWHEVAGAGHNDTYLVGGAEYFRLIRSFLEECLGGGDG